MTEDFGERAKFYFSSLFTSFMGGVSLPQDFFLYNILQKSFPYYLGPNFTFYFYKQGGWNAIDSLYRDGISSTLDIINLRHNSDVHVYDPEKRGLNDYISDHTLVDVTGPFGLVNPLRDTTYNLNYSIFMKFWYGDLLVANYLENKNRYAFNWSINFRQAFYAEKYADFLERILGNHNSVYFRPSPVSDTTYVVNEILRR